MESGDLLHEYAKFDDRMNNDKYKKKFDKYIEGVDPHTKNKFSVSVGPERFLAP